ncbi:cupin domain-containing protein [Pedobacter xixiisoli]|uniref:Cupin domain-containing protein n=1 Tax=Pedobacter xixiisoli TaxID=1476464 RepID=A0A285ZQU9_9SPHI|nr:cupin domain-containing protein [Pedobacter xixiisoli]SOD12056.1 hypothetical protein SAMN06297358_0471 [Pedobacter xixiisoli]
MKFKLNFVIPLVLLTMTAFGQDKITEGTASAIFPLGSKVKNGNFTGEVWLQMLVPNDTVYNSNIGSVTFAPGARINWHYHPGGQLLLVTDGKGLYQEEGKPY